MSSSDVSYVSSSESEAAETEVEYDLEVEGSSNSSGHETSDDEPGDAYANEPIADEEWLAQYEEERKTEEELEKKLACSLVYFPPKHKVLGSLGKRKYQFHLSVVFFANGHLSVQGTSLRNRRLGNVLSTQPSTSWAPSEHA